MKLEFETAATHRTQEERDAERGADEDIEFTIRGLDDAGGFVYVMRRPTTAQLGLFMGSLSGDNEAESVAGLLAFLKGTLGTGGYGSLRSRLNDPGSGVDFEDVMQILEEVVEKFTGFPTTPPSSSSGSQMSTGRRSTENARPVASIRSTSRLVDSSTSYTNGQ